MQAVGLYKIRFGSGCLSMQNPLLSLEHHQVQRMVRMLRSDARLTRRYAETPSCPNGDTLRDGHPAALKVRGNTQGLGNRLVLDGCGDRRNSWPPMCVHHLAQFSPQRPSSSRQPRL
jgi:hypothetical protein